MSAAAVGDGRTGEDAPLPFDVRLVPCATAAWAVTIVGIHLGCIVAAMVCAASMFGVGCGGLLLARAAPDSRAWTRGTVVALMVTACYAGAVGLRMWSVEDSPVAAAAERGAWISASATVREDPRRLTSAGPERVIVRADLDRVDIAGTPIAVGGTIVVLAPADGWDSVLPGQTVHLRGKASVPDRADMTVAVVTVRSGPLFVDDAGVIAAAAGSVRSDLAGAAAASLPDDRAGVLPGLVVGDVSSLDVEVEEDFRAAGLTHLTAVSGANFSVLLGAVLLLVRFVGIGPYAAAVLCAVVIVVFVIVARPSPSVLRAAVMGSIGLVALVTGRRKQAVPALCTAVLVLLVFSPELAVDFGFALSVIATAGLVLVAPVWVDALRARGWRRTPAEVLAVAAAAHAVTAPIVASMTGTFSVVGIAANVLVAPVVAPVSIVGSIAAVVAPLSSTLAEWVLMLTSAPLWWLISVAHHAASAPASSLSLPDGPLGGVVVIVGIAACVVLLRWTVFRWVAVVLTVWLCAGWVWHVVHR